MPKLKKSIVHCIIFLRVLSDLKFINIDKKPRVFREDKSMYIMQKVLFKSTYQIILNLMQAPRCYTNSHRIKYQ